MTRTSTSTVESRSRSSRLGFRVARQAKALVERAARIEGRSVTDFCLTALTDTARRVIDQHEALVLSDRDRAVFFETLMAPQKPNARLRRAFRAERKHIEG